MRKLLAIFAILSVLYAVFPLFGRRYIPTHDGEYHIIRIVEFSRMLGQGYIVPRWAPDMNSGYGIPIFNYHYPLPNYIGSFVRVFARDAVIAFQVSMGLAYIALAIGAYAWLSIVFGAVPALAGAIVAAFTPYVFVDTYIRGSIGEVWAITLLFWALWAIEKRRLQTFALLYGLLILSHNILALLFTPLIAGYIWIRSKYMWRGMIGGIGLSAFFWLPALVESKYVVGLNTVNFREHFVDLAGFLIPSWGSGFSDSLGNAMSTQIGITPLVVIVGALLTKKLTKLFIFLLASLGIAVLLMFPFSRPLWEVVKFLQYVQYPWRFLSFVIPVAGFCASYWVSRMHNKKWGLVIALLALIFAYRYAQPVTYEPRSEAYYLSRANFTDGTSSMGNSFSTVWTGWIQKRNPDDPIHTAYFPGWKIYVDGREVPIVNDHGIIRADIAPGRHVITKRLTETPIRRIADIISIGSLGGLLLYAYRNRHNIA